MFVNIAATIFFFSSIILTAQTQNLKDVSVMLKVTDGSINLTEGVLYITASGVPDINLTNVNSARISAEKAAKKNLLVRLKNALLKIPLSKGETFGKYLENKNETFPFFDNEEEVSNEMISSRYYSDGSVDFLYKISLDKYMKDIEIRVKNDLCSINNNKSGEPDNFLKNETVAEKEKNVLIVEIKDSKFQPSLFVTLENENGDIIFNSCDVEGNRPLNTFGLFLKKKSDYFLKEFGEDARVLTVPSYKIKNGSAIVLKNKDFEKISLELEEESLKTGKVIFLIK